MDGEQLADAFVELADTMVADFDVIDFLHTLTQRSVQLLDASAAGVLLADPRGELRLVAASTEAARVLELFQLQNDQGPCLDCFRTGQPVAAPDLTAAGQTWPQFAAAAREADFGAVQALPMRLRVQVIGALNLFRVTPGGFGHQDLRVGQALADVATIGLLQQRNTRRGATLNEQLQGALNSRVVIEQAKGKLAERLSLDMDQAFTVLRRYARGHNLRLSDLARAFIDETPADFPDLTTQPSPDRTTKTTERTPRGPGRADNH
jgi:transcriptional regulator with GAF, ATPase, and Fis domain